MTHDELLARLWEKRNSLCDNLDIHFALSAVVELHKPKYWQNSNVPEWNGTNCSHCLEERGDYLSPIETSYPCPTIQAIEKELR